MSLISREKTVDQLEELRCMYVGSLNERCKVDVLDACIDTVKSVKEVAEAHLIPVNYSSADRPKDGNKVMCSGCRYVYKYESFMRFCPVCGRRLMLKKVKG